MNFRLSVDNSDYPSSEVFRRNDCPKSGRNKYGFVIDEINPVTLGIGRKGRQDVVGIRIPLSRLQSTCLVELTNEAGR